MDNFDFLKDNLLKREQDLKERLQRLSQDDDLAFGDLMPTNEVATFAWQADIESTRSVLKRESIFLLTQIQQTLERLEKGVFGKCQKCGHSIGEGRLKVLPTATLCNSCL